MSKTTRLKQPNPSKFRARTIMHAPEQGEAFQTADGQWYGRDHTGGGRIVCISREQVDASPLSSAVQSYRSVVSVEI